MIVRQLLLHHLPLIRTNGVSVLQAGRKGWNSFGNVHWKPGRSSVQWVEESSQGPFLWARHFSCSAHLCRRNFTSLYEDPQRSTRKGEGTGGGSGHQQSKISERIGMEEQVGASLSQISKTDQSTTNNKQTTEKGDVKINLGDQPEEKLGLFKRFKLMYKNYWYVLIPVHCVTSVVWFGSFYLMAKSGVDIASALEHAGFSEKVVAYLRSSDAGYYAVAYACYKIATPARYTITLGGTTVSIKYLKEWGYIKPMPSKEKMKEMYEGKKEDFRKRRKKRAAKGQKKWTGDNGGSSGNKSSGVNDPTSGA